MEQPEFFQKIAQAIWRMAVKRNANANNGGPVGADYEPLGEEETEQSAVVASLRKLEWSYLSGEKHFSWLIRSANLYCYSSQASMPRNTKVPEKQLSKKHAVAVIH